MKLKTVLCSLLLLACSVAGAAAQDASAPKAGQITVNVLGDVTRPSRYTLPAGATVLDALAAAGDATKEGNLTKARLIHAATSAKPSVTVINIRAALNGLAVPAILHDGDTLVIPEQMFRISY